MDTEEFLGGWRERAFVWGARAPRPLFEVPRLKL